MYIILIIFLASFIGLCAMILYRMWEIKTGRVSAATDSSSRLFSLHDIEGELRAWYHTLPREKINQTAQNACKQCEGVINKLSQYFKNGALRKHVDRVLNSVKGRQELETNRKPSSPFIQDILAHKEHIRNQNKGEM